MPQPTLVNLLREADEREAAQSEAYAEYAKERAKLRRHASRHAKGKKRGCDAQHVGEQQEREVLRRINGAQAVIKGPGAIGGGDSEAALEALREEAAALRALMDSIPPQAGDALLADLGCVLDPIRAGIELLEYWHLRFPKANSRVVLASGTELYRIDEAGSLCLGAARITSSLSSSAGELTVTYHHGAQSVPLYTESADGELLAFNAEAVGVVGAFFAALLEEMGIGEKGEPADVWHELTRYLGGPRNLWSLLFAR